MNIARSTARRPSRGRRAVIAAGLAGGATLALGARAQSTDWPTRPLAITVGLQAGTGSDIAVRTVAERLGAILGQPAVIENLPGAGGVLAAQRALKSAADGHALFALSNGTLTVAPHLSKVGYDPEKDFVPAAFISGFPSVLIVSKDFPAQTLREFIDVVRRNPGKYSYGTGGVGSVQHLAMESFKAMAGIDLVHVPYKGSLQATVDIASGQIHTMFNGISTVLPYLKNGQVRALAASGDARIALAPEVPTVQEAGVPGFTYEPWTGFYLPAGTPRPIVERLNATVRRITSDPEFRAKWGTQGIAAKDMSADQMAAMLRAENAVHRKVIADKGIKGE